MEVSFSAKDNKALFTTGMPYAPCVHYQWSESLPIVVISFVSLRLVSAEAVALSGIVASSFSFDKMGRGPCW